MSSEGLPLRLGVRDGHTSDSRETPVAIEECLALGLDGVRGIVADSKAYCKRTLGLCLEPRVGLMTLVPRTCAVRQEVEAWGQQHGPLPLVLEKPGRTRQEAPRRWHGPVSSARWKWKTLTDASTWQRDASWWSTPANGLTRPLWRMPRPKPRKPSVSQRTSGAWKPAGLPVPPPPMKAVGQDAALQARHQAYPSDGACACDPARRAERATRGGRPVRRPTELTRRWRVGAAEGNFQGGHGRDTGRRLGVARVKSGFIFPIRKMRLAPSLPV